MISGQEGNKHEIKCVKPRLILLEKHAKIKRPLLKKPDLIWAGVIVIVFLIICSTILVVPLIYCKRNSMDIINNLYNSDYFNISSDIMSTKLERLKSINTSDKIIPKQHWSARTISGFIPPMKFPIKYVIICHSSARFCNTTGMCSFIVQWNQNRSIDELHKPDTSYNFFVGGDGNVYESRGWQFQNDFLDSSITISMIGNYVFDDLTEDMVTVTKELLEFGVNNSYLDKYYQILAHNQTKKTISPGPNVYKKIVKWSHYSSEIIV